MNDVNVETLADFEGKVVTFYLNQGPGWAEDGLLLESPSLTMRGGRLFVTGRTVREELPEDKPDWAANLEAGIAWDLVFYYLVMGTLEEYYAMIPSK